MNDDIRIPSVPGTEKFVIGAILREPQLYSIASAQGISEDAFFSPDMRNIWNEFAGLEASGKMNDINSLTLALIEIFPQQQKLIVELPQKIASTARFDQWLQKLLEYQVRRNLLKQVAGLQKALASRENVAAMLNDIEAGNIRNRALLDGWQDTSTADYFKEAISWADHPKDALPLFPEGTEAAEVIKVTYGKYMVIGAESGVGKTALAATITCNLLQNGLTVLYVCAESDGAKTAGRILAAMAGVHHAKVEIKNGGATKQQRQRWKAAGDMPLELSDKFLKIVGTDRGTVTVSTIRQALRKLRSESPTGRVDVVILDYIQLLQMSMEERRKNGIKTDLERLEHVSIALRDLICQENVTGIVLAQLNRGDKSEQGDIPRGLHRIKGCSQIVQDADMIAYLSRNGNTACLETQKARDSAFRVELDFNGAGYTSRPAYPVADDPQNPSAAV